MQHDGTLENCPFRGTLYIHAKSPREQLIQKNHKHGSRPKDLNKNKYTSRNTSPPQATILFHSLKSNSVRFEDPYDHIRRINNHNEHTHLIDPQ